VKIVAELNKLVKTNVNEFIPCDASLLKNVRAYTDQIKKKFQKLNYLVLSTSPTSGNFFKRSETEEGIDKNMAVSYYARFLIIKELIPLLEKASQNGEEARVLSVLSAGRESSLYVDDLELKHNYGLHSMAISVSTYTSLSLEEFARLHPTISFMHIYPGWVDTPLMNLLPLPKFLIYPLVLLSKMFATTQEECGEIMSYVLTTPKYKTGFYLLRQLGNEIPPSHNSRENIDLVWKHTINITSIGKL